MSKKKKKYYAVWKGRESGVFESWSECQLQTKNFLGAQ
ncbi:MAG: RNase H1/viroplasmin domain-containing protein, partial [Bacteroidota bacterium]|nr:RNase H1/viroplasmin domain-containing protein [Bacteroidota bacterium]